MSTKFKHKTKSTISNLTRTTRQTTKIPTLIRNITETNPTDMTTSSRMSNAPQNTSGSSIYELPAGLPDVKVPSDLRR